MRTAGVAMLSIAAVWLVVGYSHATPTESPPWWNPEWQYRLVVDLPSSMEGEAATVYVDLAALLKELDPGSEPDLGSIRVVETAAQEGRPQRDLPCLVEERIGKNAGWAWITWLRGSGRRYQIYFSALKDGTALPQPRAAAPHGHVPPDLAMHSVNIVPNAGFEEASPDENRLPATWELSGHDLAANEWRSDYDSVSPICAWSEERAHSGKKSLKLDLAKAMRKWFDQKVSVHDWGARPPGWPEYFPCRVSVHVPESRLLPLRGRMVNLRAFFCLDEGSGSVYFRLNWGEEGRLQKSSNSPLAERKGEWLPLTHSGAVHEEATSLQVFFSNLPSGRDKGLAFYLDDLDVQAEGEDLIHLSLDKQSYSLSDRTADVLVRPAIGRESVVSLRATTQKRTGAARPFMAQLKVTASEAMLAGKKIRLTVESKEQTLVAQEVPADAETEVALDISRLGAGSYSLAARIVDCDILPEGVMKPLVRKAGPFD